MKNRTIRFRFFMWLALHTLIIFILIALALFFFDLIEFLQHPALLEEELEELMVLGIVMAVLFPTGLAGAWLVAKLLLRPWNAMVVQAERISAGCLASRIEVENPHDEVGRLAATLNQTFDNYQKLLDRLHRFSYDASHQLRNPLAAIRTHSEVCLKYPRTEEEYRGVIGSILEDTDRLSRTVDQLLLLARAAGGALREGLTEVDLRKLAEDVVREGQAIGETRNIAVELKAGSTPFLQVGVPDLLREALANLLDNALKFSPDGGRIEIGLSKTTDGFSRITVTDSGPGLSPERRLSVFRPFERTSGSGKESVGLGLALVADICDAHAGRFGVDEAPGGGCCFWIELSAELQGMMSTCRTALN
ncbi:sensor histidine kinase [Pontiella agarivorans]|uniref:histidine kinase n=1 Tax=Pontiella agarivorans TaxID=3038953 RepID=A0ABU5MZV2_9BACT|nr:HAMP domain-containing sensor histidine kinase [Pontiella agarivorans]MDZ8119721.1 HAMP domain-containing sensor histidine kinase [Pontiella agarivorans]